MMSHPSSRPSILLSSALAFGLMVTAVTPRLAHAQQILNPSPAISATEVDPTSPVAAAFRPVAGVGVRPETVKVLVDNQDVTRQSVITADFFSYRPTTPFSPGRHSVLVEFTNTNGVARRVTWDFTVGSPIKAQIETVSHNAGNGALAAGENLLITVKGTPSSAVTVFLIQDGQRVQNLKAQEIAPGTYVVNVLVEAKDTTREGIVVARLEAQGDVRFVTAQQPVQLIQGAVAQPQVLTGQDVTTSASVTSNLLPQVTNYRDGDPVTGQSFTIKGSTLPNASVKVQVAAETSIGGFVNAQRTLVDQTFTANSQGLFEVPVRPTLAAPGTIYRITLTTTANGQTSPTVSLKLLQQ